jgi:5'-3' exonuclease
MGIPFLFANYYKTYGKQNELMINVEKLKTMNIQYVFFDYNSLIHPCAQQILSANNNFYLTIENENRTKTIEKDIIENCINYTKLMIQNVKNNYFEVNVYLIIDGVAPISKIQQQKERRYKSHFFKSNMRSSEKSELWDSNKITPGTKFMEKLSTALKTEFSNAFISDSNEPGEGEHKMMNIIKDLPLTNEKILIYGLDADLIMLSMLNKYSDNIILIRDNSFNSKLKEEQQTVEFVDICNLKKYIIQDLIKTFKELKPTFNTEKLDVNNLILDYILICFTLGNDFLERLPSLSIRFYGIQNVTKAYIKAYRDTHLVNKKLINKETLNKSINLLFLKDFFYHLKNQENYFLNSEQKEYTLRDPIEPLVKNSDNSDNSDNIKITETPITFFYKDSDINLINNKNFKEKYYNYYNLENLDAICYNYIEGLYWILGYYNNHLHQNWNYHYKYHNTPFCIDIFNYLNKNFRDLNVSFEENNCSSIIKQLCLVLPQESLLNCLNDLNVNETQINIIKRNILPLFPTCLYIDSINKEYLWQTKIFFKESDTLFIDLILDLEHCGF